VRLPHVALDETQEFVERPADGMRRLWRQRKRRGGGSRARRTGWDGGGEATLLTRYASRVNTARFHMNGRL